MRRVDLVFYQPATDRYRWATWTGSAWTVETIAQPALTMSGMVSIAIAVDASNVPHVAFYGLGDHGDHVYYGKRTGVGAWNVRWQAVGGVVLTVIGSVGAAGPLARLLHQQ